MIKDFETISKLPEGWKFVQLSHFGTTYSGLSGKSKEDFGFGKPYIPYLNIYKNTVIKNNEFEYVKISEKENQAKVKNGDIFFTTSSENAEEVGMCSVYDGDEVELYLNSFCFGFRIFDSNEKKISTHFLAILFRSSVGRQIMFKLGQGATRFNLSKTKLLSEKIPLPPFAEQIEIVNIVSTWDKAIEDFEKLISAKQTRNRVLMQRLLTGKQRFPQFQNKEWKTVRLGDVAKNSALRNNLGMTTENLMAVTKSSGIIPMREQVQGKTVDRCKVVQPNWFAYNPMRLNIGSIARWTGSEKVMVSPDYVVFKCDEKYLKPEYLDHFRKTCFWSQFVNRSGDGSVRVRIYFSHLEDMKISLPSIGEQEKIAETLNAADREIELLKQQRDALKRQKRGLMQKLLTGKVRVRVDEIEKNSSANSDI